MPRPSNSIQIACTSFGCTVTPIGLCSLSDVGHHRDAIKRQWLCFCHVYKKQLVTQRHTVERQVGKLLCSVTHRWRVHTYLHNCTAITIIIRAWRQLALLEHMQQVRLRHMYTLYLLCPKTDVKSLCIRRLSRRHSLHCSMYYRAALRLCLSRQNVVEMWWAYFRARNSYTSTRRLASRLIASAACFHRTVFTLAQGNSSTVRPLALRPHTYQTNRPLCGAGINSGRALKSQATSRELKRIGCHVQPRATKVSRRSVELQTGTNCYSVQCRSKYYSLTDGANTGVLYLDIISDTIHCNFADCVA